MTAQDVPVFWQYMAPVIEVLRELGGTASIAELNERVPAKLGLSAEQLAVVHDPERGNQTEVAYRIAWARTYLKKAGLIENRARGKWSLTAAGERAGAIDGQAIANDIRSSYQGEEAEPEPQQAATYLFAWNPASYAWPELEAQMREVQAKGGADHTWSCGRVKNIAPGSRFFLIRLGGEPRGIVGAGVILDAPRQDAHWEPERAAQGETSNFVDIRFDALSRVPLVTGRELSSDPGLATYKWSTQMSGVRIPDETAAVLERLWRERLRARGAGGHGGELPAHVVARWRELWQGVQDDAEWLEQQRARDARRKDVLPEMRALVTGFLRGDVPLSSFRETFDLKTRSEWDLFGLKGPSGAMFLNKFAKHLADTGSATAELQRALSVPTDEREAGSKLNALMNFLDDQIESGVTTAGDLQLNRAPFFVGACWHLQEPTVWPIMYHSSCAVLQAEGLLGARLRRGDGYVEFRRIFKALADALGIGFWNLEHLCVRLDADASARSAQQSDGAEPAAGDAEVDARVWLVSPGPGAREWDVFYREGVIALGADIGDFRQYATADEFRAAIRRWRQDDRPATNDGLANYEFTHAMKVGDAVFVKRGRKEIVGYGTIASEYRYEPARGEYAHIRKVDWHKRGSWTLADHALVVKALTEIGRYPQLVSEIRRAVELEDETPIAPVEAETAPKDVYGLEQAQQDLFAPREHIEEALELLRYKKNLVLQGPPGVGKTFFARHLAYLLLGEKDDARIRQVQFHPSYAYEDFVQGYRPTAGGKFERVNGPFITFCSDALQDQEVPYVLVIDEINRGNLSKIFGELLSLLEGDKRSKRWAVQLAYGRADELPYYVPKNLHVIGTMNTADRSLALVDYALRRRFAFFDMRPGFGLPAFAQRLAAIGVDPALRDRIVRRFERLNRSIQEDANLGEGYRIGHSYFCHRPEGRPADEAWYERIVRTEIKPLLSEYWYDARQRVDDEIVQLLDDD
jgi:hypothetical protein